jgi:hypothetical protein
VKALKVLAILAVSALSLVGVSAADLRVSLERGQSYTFIKTQFFGKLEMTPHFAVWIEDDKGAFVRTVFVSLKGGKQDIWVGRRPHPLPVWEARHGSERIPDAVGGASPAPKAPVSLDYRSALPKALERSAFSVWLEANIGFDYNESWPDDGKDLWGQPSLLFRAAFPAGAAPGQDFDFVSLGRSRGTKGEWTADLAGITSALKLFSKATAKIE